MSGDFSELLRRARDRDPAAITELHARYQRRIRGAVRRRLGPALRRACDADDVVQSVFADVLVRLPEFEDRGEDAFRHWLYTLAEHKVATKLRRELRPEGGRRQETFGDDLRPLAGGPGPATQAGDADDHARLRTVLGALDPAQREILALRDESGLAFDVIAQRLGLASPDAARMRYARALLALRSAWTGS